MSAGAFLPPCGDAAVIAADEALVAIDVGGTTTRIGAVTAGPLADMERHESRALGADPADALAALVRAAVPAGKRLKGAVIGLPVSFDEHGRRALSSPNLPGFEGRDMAAEIAARLGAPVVVDRDTVLLLTGEWVAGAAAGARSVLGVFIGTGIGGAMLLDGIPYRGASGGAVEVGHLPIRDHGRRCVCGNVDCVEAYASGHELARIAAEAGIDVTAVFADPAAAAGAGRYLAALAHGIAAAVNMMDPEVLVLGGGLFGRPEFPRQRLAASIGPHLRAPVPRDRVAIRPAVLGSESALHAAPVLFARRTTLIETGRTPGC